MGTWILEVAICVCIYGYKQGISDVSINIKNAQLCTQLIFISKLLVLFASTTCSLCLVDTTDVADQSDCRSTELNDDKSVSCIQETMMESLSTTQCLDDDDEAKTDMNE